MLANFLLTKGLINCSVVWPTERFLFCAGYMYIFSFLYHPSSTGSWILSVCPLLFWSLICTKMFLSSIRAFNAICRKPIVLEFSFALMFRKITLISPFRSMLFCRGGKSPLHIPLYHKSSFLISPGAETRFCPGVPTWYLRHPHFCLISPQALRCTCQGHYCFGAPHPTSCGAHLMTVFVSVPYCLY